MLKIKYLSILALTAGLSACSGATPDCSSGETHELVFEITKDELANAVGRETADSFSLSLDMVRTLSRDEDVGYFECAAEMTLEMEGRSETAPIEYTVTPTDDREHFYVEVFGL